MRAPGRTSIGHGRQRQTNHVDENRYVVSTNRHLTFQYLDLISQVLTLQDRASPGAGRASLRAQRAIRAGLKKEFAVLTPLEGHDFPWRSSKAGRVAKDTARHSRNQRA
jgi:hypothetical protein